MATRLEPWTKDETKGTNKIIKTIYQGHTIEGFSLKAPFDCTSAILRPCWHGLINIQIPKQLSASL